MLSFFYPQIMLSNLLLSFHVINENQKKKLRPKKKKKKREKKKGNHIFLILKSNPCHPWRTAFCDLRTTFAILVKLCINEENLLLTF